MTLQRNTLSLAALAVIAGLAACSGSGTSPQTVKNTANVNSNVLQVSVGTANIFGDVNTPAVPGLNVAATYRQTQGNPGASGTLVNGVTLTGPWKLPTAPGMPDGFNATAQQNNCSTKTAQGLSLCDAGGPSASEAGGHTAGFTAQNGTTPSSFGTSGGVFGLGIEPFNYTNFGVPSTTVPYTVPLYDPVVVPIPAPSPGDQPGVGPDPNAFVPFGGAPAFDASGNAANPANAISLGLDVFQVAPATGTYTLSVNVPANTGTYTQSATATLRSAALLPAIMPATATLNADGSAAFAITLPAGVTEAYILVTNFGPTVSGNSSCVGASGGAPIYYTLYVVSSGTATLPAGSICTLAQNQAANKNTTSDGDAFTVQSVGFDYPAFQASYPNSLKNPRPALAGANGQSDITISSSALYTEEPAAAGGAQRTPKDRYLRFLSQSKVRPNK